MFDIKLSTQLFILLALCGILIVCFINIDLPVSNIKLRNIEKFQSDITTTTLSASQQISNQVTAASITNYKKKINALFAATTSLIPISSNQPNPNLKEAYLNELTVQTLPKTNPNDIIVTYF